MNQARAIDTSTVLDILLDSGRVPGVIGSYGEGRAAHT